MSRDTQRGKIADAEKQIRKNKTSPLLLNRTKSGATLEQYALTIAKSTWLRGQRESAAAAGTLGSQAWLDNMTTPSVTDLLIREVGLHPITVANEQLPIIGQRKNGRTGRRVDLYVADLTVMDVAHALAHLVPFPEEQGRHGPHFCKAYLYIINRVVGATAKAELQAAMRAHKVKTRTWSPEARSRRSEQAKTENAVSDLLALKAELGL